MGSLNRVVLIGRLGRAPELRYTPDGQAVATLSLATDRPARPGADAEPDWHRVVLWGALAETAMQHLDKGRLVCVSGRLTYRRWEKDGQPHRTAEVVAAELVLLDRRPDAGSDRSPGDVETSAA